MSNDRIIASTSNLGDIYADSARKEFYCFVECPPLGRLLFGIYTEAFDADAEFLNDADGVLFLCEKDKFVEHKASETLARLHQLSPQWQVLWPKIYNALLQVRRDYGYTTNVTKGNCSFLLTPPNADGDTWACELELVPWDGYYVVEFTNAGDVVEAAAMF